MLSCLSPPLGTLSPPSPRDSLSRTGSGAGAPWLRAHTLRVGPAAAGLGLWPDPPLGRATTALQAWARGLKYPGRATTAGLGPGPETTISTLTSAAASNKKTVQQFILSHTHTHTHTANRVVGAIVMDGR